MARRGHQAPSIAEIVDALTVFDEPMLNSRYHGMLSRIGSDAAREALAELPKVVMDAVRAGRLAAFEWMRTRTDVDLDEAFVAGAERMLIESFLLCAEEQLRLITYMANASPTQGARKHFDEMAEGHRRIVAALRTAVGAAAQPVGRVHATALRSVQEEADVGDLRSQLETAIARSKEKGVPLRTILLSHTGLRHLRDQGALADGQTRIMDIPVSVDLGWDAPAFVLQTYHVVPLEEIVVEHS